ncbi:MAG: ABC transporter ATP-binding protein, partial [Streptomyces sp.]
VGTPRFLVLDDPLSALDVHTEALVEAALRRVLKDTTALVVAHRPSTVLLADRVALLSDGRITAIGTHQELLRENGEYAWLMSGAGAAPTTGETGPAPEAEQWDPASAPGEAEQADSAPAPGEAGRPSATGQREAPARGQADPASARGHADRTPSAGEADAGLTPTPKTQADRPSADGQTEAGVSSAEGEGAR